MADAGVAALMIAGGFAAGVFGSLLGLGGGILIVPLLTLGFNLPLREAVGVSLVAVIVTSSASASVYLQRHVANLRLGMTLELFSASGALIGGLIAFALSDQVLAGLFTVLLLYTALAMLRRPEPGPGAEAEGLVADAGAPDADAEPGRVPLPSRPAPSVSEPSEPRRDRRPTWSTASASESSAACSRE